MLANTGSGLTERLFWVAGSALVVIYALIPVAWIVSLSLKPAADIGDNRFTPRIISLEHYEAVFGDPQFSAALWNSVGIAGISTLMAVLLGMFAAYAIVRFEFPGRRLILIVALAIAIFLPSRSSGRCSICGARSGSTIPGLG